jgi:hypothetical protein
MPWCAKLIPVDELECLLEKQRRDASAKRHRPSRLGRRAAIAREIVARINDERASGKSFGEIARGLDADGLPTAQGGREW